MKKIFQICGISLSVLMFASCAKNQIVEIPSTGVFQVCKEPIVSYELGFVQHGEYDDLKIPYDKVRGAIEQSLEQSGCFAKANSNENAYRNYRLDAIYGSIKANSVTGGFWRKDSSESLIFEVQYSFSRVDEARIFYGKSSIEDKNTQYLKFIGKNAVVDINAANITLSNAINSATNEAVRNFVQLKK